ncbi:MAG: crossover junction endodeoxyribonuclease RuvC, partial [Bryobacteraceae bacterium]|nr:crossover junction endodeoxyribonuclease RuvC [Bryobacteraceae bacterium]
MRILGIDCGTERTGFGVVDSDGVRHRLIGAGVIRTSAKQALAARLSEIAGGLRGVIEDFRPER